MRTIATVVAGGLVFLIAGSSAQGGVPGDIKCAALKDKAAGRLAFDLIKVHAKNLRKPDSEKFAQGISKAESKLTTAFGKIEAKGDCLTLGDSLQVIDIGHDFRIRIRDRTPVIPGPTTTTTTSTTLPAGRIAFVTSATYTGNLGGWVGADSICQEHAEQAGLQGAFLAWISADMNSPPGRVSPSRRFGDSTPPGYYRTDGVRIAYDTKDLRDGHLLEPLNRDEHGNWVPSGAPVWTATNYAGQLYMRVDDMDMAYNCSSDRCSTYDPIRPCDCQFENCIVFEHCQDNPKWYTCTNWNSELAGRWGSVGTVGKQTVDWTSTELRYPWANPIAEPTVRSCSEPAHLYCFEQGCHSLQSPQCSLGDASCPEGTACLGSTDCRCVPWPPQ